MVMVGHGSKADGRGLGGVVHNLHLTQELEVGRKRANWG